MKSEEKYWELISCENGNPKCEEFIELLSCISHWSGSLQPDKFSTVKLCQAVTLLPRCEHLAWSKLPANALIFPGSMVIMELTTSRAAHCHVLVRRVVTPMLGNKWVPMKVLNPTKTPITLRRNTKLADVPFCLAVEDVNVMQSLCRPNGDVPDSDSVNHISSVNPVQLFKEYNLEDIDIGGCDVSESWKRELVLSCLIMMFSPEIGMIVMR